jgi:hypothetical protein
VLAIGQPVNFQNGVFMAGEDHIILAFAVRPPKEYSLVVRTRCEDVSVGGEANGENLVSMARQKHGGGHECRCAFGTLKKTKDGKGLCAREPRIAERADYDQMMDGSLPEVVRVSHWK